jgi:hypothetical protein
MTDDTVVISDPCRQPIIAPRHRKGDGVILRGAKTMLILSKAEFDRLVAFVRDEPVKARLQHNLENG